MATLATAYALKASISLQSNPIINQSPNINSSTIAGAGAVAPTTITYPTEFISPNVIFGSASNVASPTSLNSLTGGAVLVNEDDLMGRVKIEVPFTTASKEPLEFPFTSKTTPLSLIESVCTALNIKDYKFFGLKRPKDSGSAKAKAKRTSLVWLEKITHRRRSATTGSDTADNANATRSRASSLSTSSPMVWLNDDRPIFLQDTDSTTLLTLSLKYWFIDITDVTDSATISLMYSMVRDLIMRPMYFCTKEDDVGSLAALSIIIDGKVDNIENWKYAEDLKPFIPKYAIDWHNVKKWAQIIKVLLQSFPQRDMYDAQRQYLLYAKSHMPYLSTQFFPAEYATKEMQKTIPILIGLNPEGVGIYQVMPSGFPVLQTFHRYTALDRFDLRPPTIKVERSKLSFDETNGSTQSIKKKLTKILHDTDQHYSIFSRVTPVLRDMITPGPHHYLLAISAKQPSNNDNNDNNNSATFISTAPFRDIRFQLSTAFEDDSNFLDYAHFYQSSFEKFIFRVKLLDDKTTASLSEYLLTLKLIDGTQTKKLPVGPETTGAELVRQFAEKIGIKDIGFLQLAVIEDGLHRWLPLTDPVILQGVRNGAELVIKIRTFTVADPASELKDDPVLRHLYFLQTREQFLKGELLGNEMEDIIALGALLMQQILGDFDQRKKEYLKEIDTYLPRHACREIVPKKLKQMLYTAHAKLLSMSTQGAEDQFLKKAAELPTFGFTFFPGVIPRVSEYGFLAVSKYGASIFDFEMTLVGHYRFGYELRGWMNSGETIRFTVKPSRNAEEKVVKIVCMKFEEVFNLLGYYSRIRKMGGFDRNVE